ncbi:hypothetical protein PHYBOEH_011838 [Phytophthora boehmeriae]|uniref:Uncharacterized protein n=1 Tax=Phytophthora boehmeriae TaxID=109152 RepID=A0A8T1WX51_9STRA|nr:hypothetical protein PHYBOEH_011838 [Phytophthora boehmeriae]
MSPFTLTAPNKDKFSCEVETTAVDSIIRLVNQNTGDKWNCHVTAANINFFRANKKHNELQLGGLHHVVLAILQEVLKGSLGPITSSYIPSKDWCTLSLKQKYSTYFMKLKLECQIGGKRGTWSFPMNPEDPRPIYKQTLGGQVNG